VTHQSRCSGILPRNAAHWNYRRRSLKYNQD
jgi:hypothetical protein